MTTAAGTNHQVCSAVTSAAHQAASCARALPRPACPARAGSGSSPRPPHHGAQLGDLVHAERDHPALVGSVRPHPDEQGRRAVIAGVLPHRDVARDPLVTDWLARLALPVRAVIIQLWSLAVLDQLRLVRSRRLVFAGHDGVRAMCAPAQQSCEADGSPRRSVCRVTPTAHTTNDQPCRGEQGYQPTRLVLAAPRTYRIRGELIKLAHVPGVASRLLWSTASVRREHVAPAA